ncbi:MAG: RHS repeat-associated core domain-containing protein [Myxococcaceae bacterium]|nr:RHS repeat-associated core domain-containing protein [Myxococcaceae bacterium]
MRVLNLFSWLARRCQRVVSCSLVVLGLGLGVALASGESAEEVAGRAETIAQAALVPRPSLGGPKDFGASSEPVSLGSLRPLHSVVDVTVRGSVGDFSLVRYYSSTDDTWRVRSGDPESEPFGTAPLASGGSSTGRALRWWHSLYSFVQVRYPHCTPAQEADGTCDSSIPYYVVRDTSGRKHQFMFCEPQFPQSTCMTVSEAEPELKLTQGGGFVLHTPEGRYHYRTQVGETYLLSYVEDAQYDESANCQGPLGCRRRVTLSYVAPPACQGTTVDSGELFVDEALTGSGARLKFNYGQLPRRGGAAGEHECVLSSVGLVGTDGAPARTVVQYEYTEDQAALLSAAYRPETRSRTTYEYNLAGQPAWIIKQDGKLITQKLLDTERGHLLQDSGPDRAYAVTAENNRVGTVVEICHPGVFGPESLLDQVNSSCKPTQWQYFKDPQASSGDGTGGAVQLNQDFLLKNYDKQGPLLTKTIMSCEPTAGSCMGAPTAEWVWQIDKLTYYDNRTREVPRAERDSNGGWKAYVHQIPVSSIGAQNYLAPPELTTIYSGAEGNTGAGALLTQHYGYTYGERAHEQLVKQVKVDSVLPNGTSGTESTTTYQYDSATNRLLSVTQEGNTWIFQGGTWQASPRKVGTFFLTHRTCGNGANQADPLGRVLEVHGPCLVNGTQDGCSGVGIVPITQYEYYLASEAGNKANRLKRKTVFTNIVGASCAGALALTTTYDVYDARGNVLASTDANGVATTYVYEGERLLESSTAGVTTRYGFDDGATHGDYILHSAGYYEVMCFRAGTPGAACVGGTLTDKLQWKAKSAFADGRTWTEKVVYTYRAGALASEMYLDASGAVRRTRRYETDPLGRTTFEAWGSGAGSYASTAFFDAEGNRKGLGLPHNTAPGASTPPPFCDGPGWSTSVNSFICNHFIYDRLNRLTGMVEYPESESLSSKTCIGYDKQGNVERVKTGCPEISIHGDCGACTQPETRYQHDDFGNLVSVTAPWTDDGNGGAGTTHYEYDAVGNLARKQTPAMAAGSSLEYTYDSLSRLKEVRHLSGVGSETLYVLAYDNSESPPAGCPAIQTSRTLGRLQVRTDSFGDAWYQYDAWGRVTAIYRRRAGAGAAREVACEADPSHDTPNSRFTYSPDGRLIAEQYPHGREIRYRYHPAGSGQEDRVQSIEVDLYGIDSTGAVTISSRTLLRNVQWEPFGGVRAYEVVAPLAPAGQEVASIEYLLGGDNTPATSCNASRSGAGDTSGHLRALWVSGAALSSPESSRSGDIFRRTYTWKADQLGREDTCVLDNGGTAPQSVLYAYDERLRLKEVSRPAQQFSTRGGTVGKRSYTYDRRGNRLADSGREGETEDCWDFQLTSGAGPHVDWLLQRQAWGTRCSAPMQNVCPGPSLYGHSFTYDRDGRVARKSWPADSSGESYSLDFAYEEGSEPDASNHAAVGMVYRSVSVGGNTYEYFYDANGRRRLKRYPTGEEDEFFYDGDKLLEDRGNSDIQDGAPEAYTLDEYLWLDGRPVALLKSKFDTGWQRQPDLTGECKRNGEAAPCGVYFLVTDYLKKPVLMLDAHRRVAGMAEYAPFGHVNRVTYLADTAHPYANNTRSVLGYFNQPSPSPALLSQLRARYALVDVEEGYDYAYLSDQNGGELWTVSGAPTRVTGRQQGPVTAGWVEVPQQNGQGRVHARFSSDSAGNSKGIILEGYEYRHFQQGASPVWMPLRFPGQYHDTETDLFENWNRYYDPSIGRYLGSEPKMQESRWTLEQSMVGQGVPIYEYAYNNPIIFADPTGLEGGSDGSFGDYHWGAHSGELARECNEGNKASCDTLERSALAAITIVGGGIVGARVVAAIFARLTPKIAATATAVGGAASTPQGQRTIEVFHKGMLTNPFKPYLSTGMERAAVAALERPGIVYSFRVPVQKFLEWEKSGLVQRLVDFDQKTGVINREVRFNHAIVPEVMKMMVDPKN